MRKQSQSPDTPSTEVSAGSKPIEFSSQDVPSWGVLLKTLWTLAVPIMFGNLLQSLYNLVDAYFLGRLGPHQLAAPGIVFPIIFFLIVFAGAFGMAGTTLISQAWGSGDNEKVNYYLGQTFTILMITSVIVMALGNLFSDIFLGWLRVPEEIYPYSETYLRIIFLGMPGMFVDFIFRSSLQGSGDTRTPLYVLMVTITLNILLDWLLIFGIGPFPEMGVAGAAWATVIARYVSAVISLAILIYFHPRLKLRRKHLRVSKKSIKTYVKIGFPLAIGQGISTLGFAFVQGLVNVNGASAAAAFSVGNRITNIFNMPGIGLSQASGVLVGKALGAKREHEAERVVRMGMLSVGVFITICMTLVFFFGSLFMRVFTSDPVVIQHGVMLFKILAPSIIFFNIFTVITGAFQGGGDTAPVMLMNIGRIWGIRVPVGWLFSIYLGLGLTGVYWGMFLSNVLVFVVALMLYSTGRWKHKLRVDEL